MVRGRLAPLAEVEELKFDFLARELTVVHHFPDNRVLQETLNSLNLGAREKGETGRVPEPPESANQRALMVVSGLAAFAAEGVSLAAASQGEPFVVGLAFLSMIAGGKETLKKGLLAIRTFTLNINFLMTLAIVGAAVLGEWPEAAMVTFLFALAEKLESRALQRANRAVQSLLEMSPDSALVERDGEWQELDAREVELGDKVRVKPGQRIPLDGVVLEGRSSVDQSPITGESMPVDKAEGEQVFAGTVNQEGSLVFRVESVFDETTLARIVAAVRRAQADKAPTQRMVDRFARVYTPIVVLFALLVWLIPPLALAEPFSVWFYRALVVLVISCPCALVISTPITVVSALAAAARSGILVKGGRMLEEGSRLKVLAFDKTGTLTRGKPLLTEVIPLCETSEEELLRLAASLNSHSLHPIALAFRQAWKGRRSPLGLAEVKDFVSLTGFGVEGTIEGKTYALGSHKLARQKGPLNRELHQKLESGSETLIFLLENAEPIGCFQVVDALRPESKNAVAALHDLGLKMVLLSGDRTLTAKELAAEVGIDEALGDLLPEEKLAQLEELLREHDSVAMVGDGVNDAPALARASIGFAMGAAGSDTAIETADVALMDDNLHALAAFIKLSRSTTAILAQNIALAIAIKVVFFFLALTGQATLWMAVLADMGGSLMVIFNGLRLLRLAPSVPKPEIEKTTCCSSGCCGAS